MEAFTWKCIYRKNENNEFYAERYVADATEGRFIQHLDVLISKRNNAVVCLCIPCLKIIFVKIMALPRLPRGIECVWFGYVYCFNKIYKLFYDMNALNSFSTRTIVQYVDCHHRDICNKCMVYLMKSIKPYLMPFLPFFAWKPITRILTNFVNNLKKLLVCTNRRDWHENKGYFLMGEHWCHHLTQILSMKLVSI